MRLMHLYVYHIMVVHTTMLVRGREGGGTVRYVYTYLVIDPRVATVGVGLGLPAYDPGQADRQLIADAMHKRYIVIYYLCDLLITFNGRK